MGLTSSPQGLVTQSLKASGTAVLEALNEQPLSVDREERYRLSEVTHIAQEPWGQRHEEPPTQAAWQKISTIWRGRWRPACHWPNAPTLAA